MSEMTRQAPEEKRLQGHWLLAKLGKRVLRPGGRELTQRMLTAAGPRAGDRIIEFGPGVGATAKLLLATHPASWIGVDPNPDAPKVLGHLLGGTVPTELVAADAATTGLPSGEADFVIGEAMLTMQSQTDKARVVAEATRLLAPGGRYAIHELSRTGVETEARPRDAVEKDLSRTIKVGARPLPVAHWIALLEEAGLEVEWQGEAPMRLLEPSRLISDEGMLGAARFGFNLLRNRPARERVLAMRAEFRKHADELGAIALVARKPA
ncbi:methyltransferase domain-containing protein [Corynebacterium sp. H128]|uniref:class I SAM-dependent methyltransferase n=1 Tax=unclassified Corynebacterium TaxID=2624378 RepID=UPI0030A68C8E